MTLVVRRNKMRYGDQWEVADIPDDEPISDDNVRILGVYATQVEADTVAIQRGVRDWIVIAGQLLDTTKGGGFEFFGPFTKREAAELRASMAAASTYNEDRTYTAVQLLGVYRRKFDKRRFNKERGRAG